MRIAIGQGRPEIHRFEVSCFEQKLDKLSRYLNLNDRKRLSKSRCSKTFQLRFASTKKMLVKNCAIKKKNLLNSCLLKKAQQFWSKETKVTAA